MGRRGPGARPGAAKAPAPDWTPPADRWARWQNPRVHRAQRVIAFCESLPVPTGRLAGSAMRLLPFQRAWIRALYGRGPRGRLARSALLSTPRKNGKTGLAATFALAHLAGPESRRHGQLVVAANDKRQAAIAWDAVRQIVEMVPWLAERCVVRTHARIIEDVPSGSALEVLSSIAESKHGLSPTWALIDELGQARHRDLYDALATAAGAHEEATLLVLSTQSADPNPSHPMTELVDYHDRIASGAISDPDFVSAVYAADADDDPWDRRVWRRANPGLGTICSLADIEAAARRAQKIKSQETTFRRLRLNQRVTDTATYGWIARETWLAALDPDTPPLAGRAAVMLAVDWVQTKFLAVAAAVRDGERIDAEAWLWLPRAQVEGRDSDDRDPMLPHFRRWAAAGELGLVAGQVIGDAAAARLVAGAVAGDADVVIDPARLEVLRAAVDDLDEPKPWTWRPHGQGYGRPARDAAAGRRSRRPAAADTGRLAMPASIDAVEAALLAGRLHVRPSSMPSTRPVSAA